MEKSDPTVNLPATTLVIFGITGDLAQRYILPALASLDEHGQLPTDFKLVGLSRREIKPEDVLQNNTDRLRKYLTTAQMDMADTTDYIKLQDILDADKQTIFYLSVPPSAVLPILKHLSEADLNHGNTKLLLEKPFGYDLSSAEDLVEQTKKCFREEQVYRIDHFMAKEMAQNISVFLGSNALFRNVWNNQFIESIDVTASESIGIEGRADFYEQTGALRDIVQNHLMNLAALTLMHPCSSTSEFEDMPMRRLEALQCLKPADPRQAIRAQYASYKQEAGNPRSMVETFAAVTVMSSDTRWQGVPIRLATGKNLKDKYTEICVHFKQTDESQANELKLRIQPKEGVEIDLWAKQPGFGQNLRHLPMTFDYTDGADRLPDAYEQVLVDAMRSRSSLFATSQEVLETWRVLQPVLNHWQMGSADLKTYQPGATVEQVLASNV